MFRFMVSLVHKLLLFQLLAAFVLVASACRRAAAEDPCDTRTDFVYHDRKVGLGYKYTIMAF